MRRSTFTDQPVTYGAVGGTLAPDLVYYPPKGYRPDERSVRLGSGSERFEASVASLMTWGVQTGSGIEVTDVDPGTGEQYAGVRFDESGNPAELQEHRGVEAVFDESGAPYIGNGVTATLRVPFGPFHKRVRVRVVYVIDEPNRAGFAYGTLHGHPESGEEAFIVEHRDDDSVWFVLRSFSRGANPFYRLCTPLLRAQQRKYTKRYLRALHPVSGS
ncbi:MAG TPA: DUF1990 domain-containing protein [Humibacter sp.]|nr:DUF1990 domain-containing protein [Humibacter sp.]